jgi:DUF971 family protein
MSDPAITPVLVRAPRGADAFEIEWADGHVGRYPNALVRGYCPCAGCQGHSGTIAFVAGGNADLRDIEEVGNYGLQLAWADGHASGIYAFRYLRDLCACDTCRPGSAAERRDPLRR